MRRRIGPLAGRWRVLAAYQKRHRPESLSCIFHTREVWASLPGPAKGVEMGPLCAAFYGLAPTPQSQTFNFAIFSFFLLVLIHEFNFRLVLFSNFIPFPQKPLPGEDKYHSRRWSDLPPNFRYFNTTKPINMPAIPVTKSHELSRRLAELNYMLARRSVSHEALETFAVGMCCPS